ncbi:hypothetical protein KCP70_05150 [Salmonella enterica subsp. enterica]|nr:hypothetical protein KCP70_05150 [Salmonella enterica subsp. enterica]
MYAGDTLAGFPRSCRKAARSNPRSIDNDVTGESDKSAGSRSNVARDDPSGRGPWMSQ